MIRTRHTCDASRNGCSVVVLLQTRSPSHVWCRVPWRPSLSHGSCPDRTLPLQTAQTSDSIPTRPHARILTSLQVLPTHKRLLALRRGDVVRAIKMHGGSAAVAGRLGLQFQHGSLRYRLCSHQDEQIHRVLLMLQPLIFKIVYIPAPSNHSHVNSK